MLHQSALTPRNSHALLQSPPTASDPAEPIEAAVLPVTARIDIGHLDSEDLLGLLEAKLRGSLEANREARQLVEMLARILCRQLSLRVQRRCHVDATGVFVGAAEGDVFRRKIGA